MINEKSNTLLSLDLGSPFKVEKMSSVDKEKIKCQISWEIRQKREWNKTRLRFYYIGNIFRIESFKDSSWKKVQIQGMSLRESL